MIVGSLNVNSMYSARRRSGAFSAIRLGSRHPDIITFGDTRCQSLGGSTPSGYCCFLSPAVLRPTPKCPTNRHRGVALLIRRHFAPVFKYRDTHGNLVMVVVTFSGRRIMVVSTYAPCSDPCNLSNLSNITSQLSRFRSSYDEVILTGDLNITLRPKKDSFGYRRVNNPRSKLFLELLLKQYRLYDPMLNIGSTYYKYSKSQGRLLKRSRLDYIMVTKGLLSQLRRVHKNSGTFSDHRAIFLDIRDFGGRKMLGNWRRRLRRRKP